MSKYFDLTLADESGISGDDLNRRYREKNLGFLEPSPDWIDSEQEIRCIYPGQTITRFEGLGGREIHIHSKEAYFNPGNMFDKGVLIISTEGHR